MKIDLKKLKTVSLSKRKSKVRISDFARCTKRGDSFAKFIQSLPKVLAAEDFKGLIFSIKKAKKHKRTVLFMLGAHVVKCGLNPVIIDLMKKGFITHIALNGAGAIHDFELAYAGHTSEDVEASIKDGSFGMSRETSQFFNRAIDKAAKEGKALGSVIGRMIIQEKLPYRQFSILANAAKFRVGVTIHVAFGTDIIHPHPGCDGAKLGRAAMADFHNFIEVVSGIEGGVVLNIGSAVILPEVFLKAVSTVRNLKFKTQNFTAACLDMIRHYRPQENVVRRPITCGKGKGYYIVGHHEIMLPLLHRALIEQF
ncbi:MAG: hypothetical protein KKB82_00680 [Candidatus Omnitrophica bacterium]|nr:hypothetical protein [Candidatus Omnitrophota bacterium]MBU1924417.1 hypothetical protein [Candidatus Omnitrophota bacterium]